VKKENIAMNKTRVDDMLIEMITPKVKEIEKKFSSNQALTQEDINTLLLKSQYNHINHLDMKLDEVTADVASLKGEFSGLKGEFNSLRGEFNSLRGEFKTFKAEIKADLAEFKTDIQMTINNSMKWYIGSIALVLIVMKALDLIIK